MLLTHVVYIQYNFNPMGSQDPNKLSDVIDQDALVEAFVEISKSLADANDVYDARRELTAPLRGVNEVLGPVISDHVKTLGVGSFEEQTQIEDACAWTATVLLGGLQRASAED